MRPVPRDQMVSPLTSISFVGVPSMVFDLAESPLVGNADMLNIGFGGAPAAANIPELAQKSFPNAQCSQGYGMTETNAAVANFAGPNYASNPRSTCVSVIINVPIIVSP